MEKIYYSDRHQGGPSTKMNFYYGIYDKMYLLAKRIILNIRGVKKGKFEIMIEDVFFKPRAFLDYINGRKERKIKACERLNHIIHDEYFVARHSPLTSF